MNDVLFWINLILLFLLGAAILYNIRYRRQIQEVCRQLSFHRQENSNQEIRVQVRTQEILQLQEQINALFREESRILMEYQNADQSLKDMITNISHDIRTPLTSIDGYFQLLCQTEEKTEREKYRKIIEQRIESLSEILEQLFTYVRIQNHGISMELTACDMKQCLCENLFSFYEDFKNHEMEPEVVLPEEPVYLLADVTQLSRILQNILKNALVHGKDKIKVELSEKKGKLILNVWNGTDETHSEAPELVFERFFRGDKSRSSQSSGLGLCIAKELTEQMKGTIRAYYERQYFGIEIIFDRMER